MAGGGIAWALSGSSLALVLGSRIRDEPDERILSWLVDAGSFVSGDQRFLTARRQSRVVSSTAGDWGGYASSLLVSARVLPRCRFRRFPERLGFSLLAGHGGILA